MADQKDAAVKVVTDPISFKVACLCNDGCTHTKPIFEIVGGSSTAWQTLISEGRVRDITCPGCKCKFGLVHDGRAVTHVHTSRAH